MPVMKKVEIMVGTGPGLVKASSLILWPNNPRRNDAAVPKLAELLKRNGQRSRLTVWNKNMTVYKGNTTLKAIRYLIEKWTVCGAGENREFFDQVRAGMVKVELASFPSEAAADAYGISDNKASEWSEWDEDVLREMLTAEEMTPWKGAVGFSDKDVEKIFGPQEFKKLDPKEMTGKCTCPKCGYEFNK